MLSHWVVQLDANEEVRGNVAAIEVTSVANKTGPLSIHQDPVPGLKRHLLLLAGFCNSGAADGVELHFHLLAVGAVTRVDAASQRRHLGAILKYRRIKATTINILEKLRKSIVNHIGCQRLQLTTEDSQALFRLIFAARAERSKSIEI